jgi:tight adherence protein B
MLLLAGAIVVVAGLAAAAVTLARPGVHRAGAPAKREPAGRERFDLVGEGHPTGGIRAHIGTTVFPSRLIVLSVPGRAPLLPTRFHVVEDGTAVLGLTVSAAGHVSSLTKAFEPDAPPVSGPRSQYLIRYDSRLPRTENEVELAVAVDGIGAVDLDYAAVSSTASAAGGAAHTSFWTSARGLIAISAIAALLIALALMALLAPRRRSALQRRVGEFTAQTPGTAEPLATPTAPSRLPGLERLLGRLSWWPGFSEQIQIAGFHRPAAELVAIDVMLTVAVSLLIGAAVGAFAITLVLIPLGPFALRALVHQRLRKQRQLFGDQLAPHLEELASAMRAGHGLVAGLVAMVASAAEPSRAEWGRVLADEQLGMPLDIAMRSLAKRMDCDDVEQVALVATLHSRTGGNMAEVLDRVADGVRERADLRRELRALTSQARLSRWVVTALPPALIGVIELIDPAYMRPLLTTTLGIVMLGIALVLLIAGSMVMRAVTEIKV